MIPKSMPRMRSEGWLLVFKREVQARATLRGLKSLHPWLTEGLNAIVAPSSYDAAHRDVGGCFSRK
jgi:hypothetical protein